MDARPLPLTTIEALSPCFKRATCFSILTMHNYMISCILLFTISTIDQSWPTHWKPQAQNIYIRFSLF